MINLDLLYFETKTTINFNQILAIYTYCQLTQDSKGLTRVITYHYEKELPFHETLQPKAIWLKTDDT